MDCMVRALRRVAGGRHVARADSRDVPPGGYFMSAPPCKGASAAGGAFFLIGSSCSSRLVDDPAIRLTPDFAELCRHGTKPHEHCPG